MNSMQRHVKIAGIVGMYVYACTHANIMRAILYTTKIMVYFIYGSTCILHACIYNRHIYVHLCGAWWLSVEVRCLQSGKPQGRIPLYSCDGKHGRRLRGTGVPSKYEVGDACVPRNISRSSVIGACMAFASTN